MHPPSFLKSISLLRLVLAAAVWLGLSVCALAQQPAGLALSADDPCVSDAKCNRMVASAKALSESGQYEAALLGYQGAYALQPVPWLLLNIGRMQQKLGRYQSARDNFRTYLDSEAAKQNEALANKVMQYLKQAEEEVAAQKTTPKESPPLVPAVAPPSAAPVQPLYKKGWFWAVLGGGVAAVGLAVGLGVGLSQRTPTLPDGVNTYAPSF